MEHKKTPYNYAQTWILYVLLLKLSYTRSNIPHTHTHTHGSSLQQLLQQYLPGGFSCLDIG